MANRNALDMPLASSLNCITRPLQPVFCAYMAGDVVNATGDNTVVAVPFGSTYFNIGSCYNTGTYVFTAPVSGMYMIGATLTMSTIPACTLVSINCYTTPREIKTNFYNINNLKTSDNIFTLSFLVTVPLTATNTVSIFTVASGSTKTITLVSGTASTFWGYLIA